MKDELAELRRTVAWLDTASQDLWWVIVTMFVHQIRASSALSAAFPPSPSVDDLIDTSQVPPNAELWAARAFLTLERHIDRGYGSPGSRPGQLRDGKWGHKWEQENRAMANDLYVRPVVAWLEAQVGGVSTFHAGVERWIQRLRWFGGEGSNEEFYQEELARFLFDDGVAIEDIGREAHSAGGRVDFLLRGGLLLPVEMKLWRGPADDDRLAPPRAPAQAARYAKDYRVARSYLVVVATADSHRLMLPPAGRTVDGIDVLLRVAEVRPPSPSSDRRVPRVVHVADLGLTPA